MVTNIVNGKVYVGKTGQTIDARWKEHLKLARLNYPSYFYRAMRKYGPDMFKVREIDCVETNELANVRETYWITQVFKSHCSENGYNSTLGGEGVIRNEESERKRIDALQGRKVSEETRRKISVANSGRKFSDEHRKKLSDAKLGDKHPLFGKHHSEETRKKMSKTHLRRQEL